MTFNRNRIELHYRVIRRNPLYVSSGFGYISNTYPDNIASLTSTYWLILGGYKNPIPLDETIDAMFEVGKAMPTELKCTARGGIAISPSAIALKPH